MSLRSDRQNLLFCEIKTSNQLSLPDGGWGWVVVFASTVVSFVSDGFCYSVGEFYKNFLSIYKQSEAATSLFSSIMTGVLLCTAPVTSGLIEVYGCRTVSLMGATLTVLGMVLSVVFDQSVYLHCVTLGLISGLGLGFVYVSQILIITAWFDNNLALATGLGACGSGFGMACFCLVNTGLIDIFGWKGTMLVLASLMSFCLSMSTLYCHTSVQYFDTGALFSYSKFMEAIRKSNDIQLLRDCDFVLVVLSSSLWASVYFVPFVLTPDRVVSAGWGTDAEAGMLLVYMGIFNGIGRIVLGFVFTSPNLSRVWLYFILLIATTIVLVALALMQSITHMTVLFIFLGFISGGCVIAIPIILVDLFGAVRVANAFGILCFLNGWTTVFGLPLLNLTVNEVTPHNRDRYRMPFMISGLITLLAGVCLALIPLRRMMARQRMPTIPSTKLQSQKDV